MLNQRHAAAQKVAAHLMPAEDDLQNSIVRNAQLQIAIVEARRDAGVPKNIGTEALVHLAGVSQSLAQAWRGMIEAHHALHEDQRLSGLGAFAYGDVTNTPKRAALADEPLLKIA